MMGVQAPKGLIGIHTNMAGAFPPELDAAAFAGAAPPPGKDDPQPSAGIKAIDPETGKTAEQGARFFITVPFLVIEAPTLTVDSPAEGSQFENVVVFDDGLGRTPQDRARWLYTAITRAERGLVLLD